MMKVRTFSGRELAPYIDAIAQLRIEVFHEWPYLYEGDIEYEKKYLKKFIGCEEAFFVVVFDGSEIVGISSGLPLRNEDKEMKKPFLEKGISVDEYFYFSESVLKKAYRGQGLGHLFFDAREAFVKKLGTYSKICFCSVIREITDPRRPEDYHELSSFWKKRGYVPLEGIISHFSWNEIGEQKETEKGLQFWTKDLP